MLVLEAQAYLLEVLCKIVESLLEGVDNTLASRAEKWKELTAKAGFRETGAVELCSSYTHQAFSPPPDFDCEYLISLARTRRDATGDHLRYLQCDVPYLRRHIRILFSTEIFKKASNVQKGLLLALQIRSEVRSHHWWAWIEMECRHVDAVQKAYRDSIHSGSPLPGRYDRALGSLELLLVNQVL
ncbi:hypothetical protein BJX65DRAFT_307557 [Aspergillus insuetus]